MLPLTVLQLHGDIGFLVCKGEYIFFFQAKKKEAKKSPGHLRLCPGPRNAYGCVRSLAMSRLQRFKVGASNGERETTGLPYGRYEAMGGHGVRLSLQ